MNTLPRSTANLAARIYTLALLAHSETCNCETDAEYQVVNRATKRAQESLERLGIDRTEVATLADCVAVACEMDNIPLPG